MSSELFLNQKKYISAKEASLLTSYSKDYIGQLCRSGKVDCTRIGRTWYISEESILKYKDTPTDFDFSKNLKKTESQDFSFSNTPVVSSFKNNPKFVLYREKISDGLVDLDKKIFSYDFSFFKKVSYIVSVIVLLIGFVSVAQSLNTFAVNTKKVVYGLSNISKKDFAFVSNSISKLPFVSYEKGNDLVDFYANGFSQKYISFGSEILKSANMLIGGATDILKNPPHYIVLGINSLSVFEKNNVDKGAILTANIVLEAHSRTFAFISDTFTDIPTTKEYTKNSLKSMTSSVAFAVDRKVLSPVDVAGIKTYTEINNFFDSNVYSPLANFFYKRYFVISPATTTPVIKAPIVAINKTENKNPTTNIVTNNVTTRVVERVTERLVPSGISSEELDLRLQELNNKIMEKFYQLSTGNGGNVTNIYNQIAQSQRIDQLTGTEIINPTITGGSITNTSINASSITANSANLGTTTISNLAVTGTATSTFAGGVDITSGCFSVNGVCVTGGGSGSGNVGAGLEGQFAYYANSGTTLAATSSIAISTTTGNIGIGTTSPYRKFSVEGDAVISGNLYTTLINASTGVIDTFSSTLATITGLNVTNSTTTNATTTNSYISNLYALNGVIQNSTSTNLFATKFNAVNSTTTTLAISGVTSSILKTDANGNVIPAISGTDFISTTTGNWTGTFDGQEGSYYLNATNLTNFGIPFYNFFSSTSTSALAEGSNLYYTDARVNSYVGSSTTIPKTYTNNTFTGTNTFNGSLTFGTLNGPLQANNGVVSATTSIGVLYGGTGLAVAPTYGQLLLGNSTGGYTLTSTSSLGIIGGIQSLNGLSALSQTFATSSTNGGFGFTSAGSVHTLNIPTASGSSLGLLSSSDWTVFNNKISSSSLSATNNLTYNSSTGVFGVTAGYNIPLTASTTNWNTAYNTVTASSTDWNTAYLNRIISSTYPLQISANNISLAFGTTTANTWSGLQQFNGNASTTQLTTTGGTYLATTGGNVGIGTTTPPSTLTVSPSAITANPVLLLGTSTLASGSANGTYIGLNAPTGFNGNFVDFQLGNTSAFKVNSSGGVGAASYSTGITSANYILSNSAGLTSASGGTTIGWGNAANGAIQFTTGSSERMRIDTVGNVGIGTTTPFGILSVNSTAGKAAFVVGSSTKTSLIVDQNGNVGINGVLNPSYALHVNNSIAVENSSAVATVNILANASSAGDLNFGVSGGVVAAGKVRYNNNTGLMQFFTNQIARVGIDVNGNVGIGTTSPFTQLSVVGNGFFTGNITGSNLTATGTLSVTGNTTLAQATTTNLAISNVTSTLLKTNASGSVIPAIAGTDYQALLSSTYPLQISANNISLAFGTTTNNTWSGTNTFNGSLTFGTLNGPLQANNGVVSATTSIGVLYGGTGLTSYSAGDILYADASGNLAKLPVSTNGLVLKLNGGLPSWQTDLTSGGGGGATAWSTSTNSMIIYPTDTTDILVIGAAGTSTPGNLFEVYGGNSLFGGNIKVTGNASTSLISANSASFGGTATSSFDNAGVLTLASALGISSGGTGLSSVTAAGVLLGNYAGTGYMQLATSSLGLLTTNVAEGSNLYYTDTRVNSYINSSTTIPKTYTNNTFTGTNTFNGSLTFGNVAINSLLSTNASGVVVATSTPTFGNFNATSTTATSTIAGGLNIGNGGLVYDYSSGKVGIGTSNPSQKLELGALGGIRLNYLDGSYGVVLKSNNLDVGLDGLSIRNRDDSAYASMASAGFFSAYSGVSNSGGFMNSDFTAYRTSVNVNDTGTIVTASTGQYGWSPLTGFGFGSQTNDTGLARNSAGVVKVTDGSTGFGNLIAGNVGVGTTSPWQELSVSGDLSVTGRIYDSNASAGTNGMVLLTTGSGTQWIATSSLGIAAGGITSLNGLTASTQTFATSSTNGGFGFTSAGSVHTLNIPTASGSSLGLLSSSDWTVFNNKISSSSLSATNNLTYNSSTGVFGVTAGYNIPLTASTTNWNTAYNTVTASSTDWNTAYLNRIISSTYPLQISANNISLAFGTTTANTWSGTNTFNGSLTFGNVAINSLLSTNASGVVVATSTPTFGNFNATSTTATSTIAGGLNIGNGGLVYDYSSGKVGIGTSSPSQLLTVGNNNQFTVDSSGNLIAQMATIGSTNVPPIIVSGNGGPTSPNGTYSLAGIFDSRSYYKRADNAFYIYHVSSPGQYWVVSNSLGSTSNDWFVGSSGVTPPTGVAYSATGVTGSATLTQGTSAALVADSNGNLTLGGVLSVAGTGGSYIMGPLGIGTTSPFTQLSVVGNGFFTGNITGSNLTATGTLSVTGNTTLAQATTTNLAISNVTSTLLKTNASGSVIPAIAGTDYQAAGTYLTALGTGYSSTTNTVVAFSTTTSTTNGLTSSLRITSTAGALTFAPSLSGTLTLAGGGTATTTFYNGGVVFSDSTKLTQTASPDSFFWDNTNLRLGLGTSTPFAKLSVNSIAGEPALVVGSSTGTSLIVDKNGNVGIGTASPTNKLHVYGGYIADEIEGGPANIYNITHSDINSGGGHIEFQRSKGTTGTPTIVTSTTELGQLQWRGYDGANYQSAADITAFPDGTPALNSMPGSLYFSTTPSGSVTLATRMVLNSSGNLGIGTSTPLARLNVYGGDTLFQTPVNSATAFSILNAATTSVFSVATTGFGTTTLAGLNISGSATSTSNVGFNITTGCFAVNGTCVGTYGDTNVNSYINSSTTIPKTYTNNTFTGTNTFNGSLTFGNVAINSLLSTNASGVVVATSTPTFGNFNATSTTATSTIAGGFAVGTNKLVVDRSTGNIGMGTASPAANIDIVSTNSTLFSMYSSAFGTNSQISLLSTPNADGDLWGRLFFGGSSTDGASINAIRRDIGGGGSESDLAFFTDGSVDNLQERMRITSEGLIGLGTSTPTNVLTSYNSTASQLSLSAGAGIAQWAFRNAGGNLYLSTTTVAGTATTSIAALSVSGTGFGTTTVRGLNISGSATSTSNVGFNITGGCFALNGTCIGGSAAITSLNGLTASTQTFATSSTNGGFGFTSAGSVHTLNIPTASGSSLGLLSSSDWTVFNNKISSSSLSATSNLTYNGSTGVFGVTAGYNIPLTASTTNWNNFYNTPSTVISAGTGLSWSGNTLNASNAFTGSGSNGYVTRWTGTNSLGTGTLLDDGTNAGVNVLASGYTFAIQGAAGLNPFGVTSYLGDQYVVVDQNGKFGIGSTTPYAQLSVNAPAGVDSFAIGSSTGNYFKVDKTGNVSMGTTNSTTTITGGLDVGNGSLVYDVGAGLTSISNLALGSMSFDPDSGVVSWIDMPVTPASSAGTKQSYTSSIDGVPLLTLYSESDGVGGTRAQRVAIGTTTPYARLTVWATSTADHIFDVVNTSSTTLLSVSGTGFGTTTLAGLNISGQATSTSNVGFNITGGCFALNGTCVGTYGDTNVNSYINSSTTIPKTYTNNTFTGLQTFAYSSSTAYSSFVNASTTNLIINGQTFNSLLGSGLLNTGNALTLDTTFLNTTANSYINSSTTIPKTYTNNTFTGTNTFNGSLTFGNVAINSLLSTNASGVVVATSTPTFGNFNATSTTATSTIAGGLAVGGTNFVVDSSTGFVGIGTSSPLAQLHVANTHAANVGGIDFLVSDNTSASNPLVFSHKSAPSGYGSVAILGFNSYVNVAGAAGQLINSNSGGWEISSDNRNISAPSLAFRSISSGGISTNVMTLVQGGSVGFSTTSSSYPISSFSSSASQLSLSAGAGIAQWAFRNAGGNLYFSTTTVAGTATTSIAAFSISGSGFGTTTLAGLNISGQATSTSNVGFNITGGCFAVNGTCVGGGSGTYGDTDVNSYINSSTTIPKTYTNNTFTGTNTFNGSLTFGNVAINSLLSTNASGVVVATSTPTFGNFIATSTTATSTIAGGLAVGGTNLVVDSSTGGVGIGTGITNGTSKLLVNGNAVIGGTSNPQGTKLYVNGTSWLAGLTTGQVLSAGAESVSISTYNPSRNVNTAASISFTAQDSGFALQDYGRIGGVVTDNTAGAGFGDMYIKSLRSGTLTEAIRIKGNGNIGIGTSTPLTRFNVYGGDTLFQTPVNSDTAFSILNAATTSVFSVATTGFGTTTLAGLNISGQATSTSNVGFNITGGCFAVNGTCVGGGSFSNTLAGGGTATTTFYNGGVVFSDSTKLTQTASPDSFFWDNTNLRLGLGSSTPFAKLSVNSIAGEPAFVVGSSTGTSLIVDKNGNVGIGTSSPYATLSVQPEVDSSSAVVFANAAGGDVLKLDSSSGLLTLGSNTSGSALKLQNSTFNTLYTSIASNGISMIAGGSGTRADIQFAYSSTPGVTSGTLAMIIKNGGNIGIGTSTPLARFNVYGGDTLFQTPVNSATAFSILNAATTSVFSVATTGFGTTTLAGLNISGSATSTSNVGFNITTGCYAVNGTCISGGGSFTNTLANGGTATTTFYNGGLVFSDGTKLTQAPAPSDLFWDNSNRRLGLGTSTPTALLSLQKTANSSDLLKISSTTGASMITVSQWGGFTQNISSTTAFTIQDGSGNQVFNIDTTQSSTGSGVDITANGSQTANLFNLFSSAGTFLAGYTSDGGFLQNISSTSAFRIQNGSGTDLLSVNTARGTIGVGTSTASYLFTLSSTTSSQLALSAGAGISQWAMRNAGGNLYLATTTVAGTATSSISALSINGTSGTTTVWALNVSATGANATSTIEGNLNVKGVLKIGTASVYLSESGIQTTGASTLDLNNGGVGSLSISNTGFGTTTVSGLNVSGQATSTSNVGFNITGGCYAINGVCPTAGAATVSIGSAVSGATNGSVLFVSGGQLQQDNANFYYDNSTEHLGLGSSTPFAKLSVNSIAGEPAFVVGSSTGTSFIINSVGNVGIGTSTPTSALTLNAATTASGGISFGGDTTLYRSQAGVITTDGSFVAGVTLFAGSNAVIPAIYGSLASGGSLLLDSTSHATKGNIILAPSGGNVGIGTSTPFAQLSVVGGLDETDPVFMVATTSNIGPGQRPLIYAFATTTGALDYARVGIGTTSPWGSAGLRDQLTVDGRLYTTWRYAACDVVGGSMTASLTTTDTANVCGQFLYDSDTDSGLQIASSYPPYAQMRAGVTNPTAGDGATLRMGPLVASATSSPIVESWVRISRPGAATTTPQYIVGLYGSAYGADTTNLPVNGIYFIATSSANWKAVTRKGSVETMTDTGVATSSTAFQKLRVEANTTDVYFIINGTVVAKHTTNIPSAYLSPTVLVSNILNNGLVNNDPRIDISLIRFWVDDPVGSAPASSDENFILKTNNFELASSTLPSSTLDLINLVQPVTYRYESDNTERYGFVLNDVDLLEPKLVVHNSDGVATGIDSEGFISILAKGMQEMDAKVVSIDKRLQNLEQIIASSTPQDNAPTFSIDTILAMLSNMGARFENGLAYLKDVFVENLTIGTKEKPSGITLYDEVTGEPYCLKVRSGATVALSGECGKQNETATTTPTTTGDEATTTPVTNGDTATTTPEVVGGGATTTPETSGSGNGSTTPEITNGESTSTPKADTTLPIISLMGSNPAEIVVGSSYVDLGASVRDTDANGVVNDNLGIHYNVDGKDLSEISIDTSTTSTHTIIFSATDAAGNVGTATRTVNVVKQ